MSAETPTPSASEPLQDALAAIERATAGDTPAAVDAMRYLALHVEDLTGMFLSRVEKQGVPYPLASDEGLAAVWRLTEMLRYARSPELAEQADDRLGYIADAAGSGKMRTLRELEARLVG